MTPHIAVLDDYQNVASKMADWSHVTAKAQLIVFNDTVSDPDELVARLEMFDVLYVMRERMPLPRTILECLPKLKLIVSTGNRNASIDAKSAEENGIKILHRGYFPAPAIELTWGLILGSARRLVDEAISVRSGGWQEYLGMGLRGKTLSILGLGKIGVEIAKIGQAFGMKVIAWSENLTVEKAAVLNVERVSKEELFTRADILTILLVLSERSRGLINAQMLASMKASAYVINTSRGAIVTEEALLAALSSGKLAGATMDVYKTEPLPKEHPYGHVPNILATPHIGYVADDLYKIFFQDTVEHLTKRLRESEPSRVKTSTMQLLLGRRHT